MKPFFWRFRMIYDCFFIWINFYECSHDFFAFIAFTTMQVNDCIPFCGLAWRKRYSCTKLAQSGLLDRVRKLCIHFFVLCEHAVNWHQDELLQPKSEEIFFHEQLLISTLVIYFEHNKVHQKDVSSVINHIFSKCNFIYRNYFFQCIYNATVAVSNVLTGKKLPKVKYIVSKLYRVCHR